MLVTILPFFLAARVAIPKHDSQGTDQWRFGAEYTYDVTVNTFLRPSLSTFNMAVPWNHAVCTRLYSVLKCRSKGSDTLSCRFHEATLVRKRVLVVDGEDSVACMDNTVGLLDFGTRLIDPQPFEIRFNRRGIENLVVRRTIPRHGLDAIKAIVAQLHVGLPVEWTSGTQERANLRGIVIPENTTAGRCDVEVKVTSKGEFRRGSRHGHRPGDELDGFEELSRSSLKQQEDDEDKKEYHRPWNDVGRTGRFSGFALRQKRQRYERRESEEGEGGYHRSWSGVEDDRRSPRSSSRQGQEENSKEGVVRDFRLLLMNDQDDFLAHDVILDVEKIRNPAYCPRRPIYLFGRYGDERGGKSIFLDTTSSISRMTISKNGFSSYTMMEGIARTRNGSTILRPRQTVRLTLKRIDPAKSVLPPITRPASTNVHAYSTYDGIFRRKRSAESDFSMRFGSNLRN